MIRIKSAYIDGYGKFQDTNFDFGSANLILLVGKNESGKSTFFNFLRTQLSGFNNFRNKENHYFPLNGGKHGGRIELENTTGRYQFERYASKKILNPLQDSKNSTFILDQINRIELADYRALFAFDLDELKQLSLLEKDELTEKLFSTGLSGANSLITNGMKDLKDRSQEIYRPRTSNSLQDAYDEYLLKQENNNRLKIELADYQIVLEKIANLKNQLNKNEAEYLLLKNSLEKFEHQQKTQGFLKKKNKYDFDISLLSKYQIPTDSDFEKENYLHTKKVELAAELSSEHKSLQNIEANKTNELKLILNKTQSAQSLLDEASILSASLYALENENSSQFKNLLISALSILIGSIIIQSIYEIEIIILIGITIMVMIPVLLIPFMRLRSKKHLRSHLESQIETIHKKQEQISLEIGLKEFTKQSLETLQSSIHDRIEAAELHCNRVDKLKNTIVSIDQEILTIHQKYNVVERTQFKKLLEIRRELKILSQTREDFINFVNSQGVDLNDVEDVESLSDTYEKLNLKLSDLELRNENLKSEIARTEVKKENLLHSTAYDENSLEVAIALDKANGLYANWQSSIVAEAVLKEVLSELYISKYRTVLESSSKFIEKITLGDYKKVILGQNESELILVGQNGKQFQMQELSRGTIEQLYLSLRLSLALSYGEKFGKVPLIFDDILVNFHFERARETMTLLKSISQTHQIIFFTCHNWIREIFESISDESTKVLEVV